MRLLLAFWFFINPVTVWGQILPAAVPLPTTQIATPSVTAMPVVESSSSTAPPITYQTENTANGMALTWQIDPAVVASTPAAQRATQLWTTLSQQLPQVRFGDYLLPMYLVPVLLSAAGPVTPQMARLETEAWTGTWPTAAPLHPAVAGSEDWGPPILREVQTVPTAPVFLLRDGWMRGSRLGVIAVSPFYVEHGITKVALKLDTIIPGAKQIAIPTQSLATNALTLDQAARSADPSIVDFTSFTNKPLVLQPPAVEPTNPVVGQNAFKLQVSHAGIQRIRGEALLAAGMSQSNALDQLQLTYQGRTLPLEIRDDDGLLDAATEVRFYARPAVNSMQVGDRWNETDTYWLTAKPVEPLNPRMLTRNAFPKTATLRQTAYEHGLWEANQIYESNMAGVDGDHWFGAKLEIETVRPDDPAGYPFTSITLTHALPLDRGSIATSVFTLTGSARSIATHTLHVNLGAVVQPLTWSNQNFYENWQHTFTRTVQTDQVDLVLIAVLEPSMIRIDKLAWQQPVQLDFRNQGAVFWGVPGLWRYQLQNLPAERTVYDITDPLDPVILQIPAGPKVQFEDGPAARTYLVSGEGTLYTPTIARHNPVVFAADGGADALYIALAQFHEALAPLVTYRRQQGYQTQVIDVQQIYDAWSYGQVSPVAIRDFLRYAVSHWNPAPIAVTLVGDSTLDPRNYTGVRDGINNVNLMPAYLAPIDPWIGETACESCFAQLDGADPLDRSHDPGFLVDIWLGRLSIQDETQLTTVVDKILHYETSVQRDPAASWHHTALYVADNHVQANGAIDPAGDFPYLSDLISEGDASKGIGPVQPAEVNTRRLYYDPSADGVTQPWREPNAARARLRTIDEINQGPALITYNGHGNHFLLATTDPNYDPPYLFGANDIFELTNQDQLPILLEMTCFTAQFTFISPSGHTIDERFLRHTNGGAVAVWGSAGLTVAVGHDWLQQGFHRKLWKSPPFQARLGELTAAGYTYLFAATACCQETRYVYLLLGDPLTPALISTPQSGYSVGSAYLPIIRQE